MGGAALILCVFWGGAECAGEQQHRATVNESCLKRERKLHYLEILWWLQLGNIDRLSSKRDWERRLERLGSVRSLFQLSFLMHQFLNGTNLLFIFHLLHSWLRKDNFFLLFSASGWLPSEK